jgi:hypothetical protein
MSNLVRRVDAFYEATGPYAVNKSLAESLYGTTFGIVSKYAGHIGINGPIPMRVPITGGLINPDHIKFGPAPHTMLLTRRGVDLKTGPDAGITDSACDASLEGKLVRNSKTIVQVQAVESDPTAATLISGIHEVGHSFGLGHCSCSACVMHPVAFVEEDLRVNEILGSGAPFCDNCAEDLEIGGFLALASNLD